MPESPVEVSSDIADDNAEAPPSKLDEFTAKLDVRQEKLSSRLENYARNIDHFFGDDRAFFDANETTGQISFGMYPKEAEGARFDFRVRVKVDLPRTKQRLRLLIESDPRELGESTRADSSFVGAAQKANYSLAVETQLQDTGKWEISPATGIKISSWPPDPYFRIRAVRHESINDWLLRYTAGANYYVVKGPTINTHLDFDRSWVDDKLLRFGSDLEWKKDRENNNHEVVTASQSVTLFHALSERTSMAYSTGVSGDDDPLWWVDAYSFTASYRRAIYKQWMYASINPELIFPRDRNFSATWGIQLRLEAFLGKSYRAPPAGN